MAEKIKQKIENYTDIPAVTFSDELYIEVCGKSRIEIDGIKKILECNSSAIKIKFKTDTVIISGKQLYVKSYENRRAVLGGTVSSISFE